MYIIYSMSLRSESKHFQNTTNDKPGIEVKRMGHGEGVFIAHIKFIWR